LIYKTRLFNTTTIHTHNNTTIIIILVFINYILFHVLFDVFVINIYILVTITGLDGEVLDATVI